MNLTRRLQQMHMYKEILLIITLVVSAVSECQPCFYTHLNLNCDQSTQPLALHMSVHPHLDAFWIYDFDTYYSTDTNKNQQAVGYLQSNRMTPVNDIFNTALRVLLKSKRYREEFGEKSQKARRTFFNSEIGFFKHWYLHLNPNKQQLVKQLIRSGYWEIVGGGFVEHDQGCAYYEDIIENYELGLHFLKENFNYFPKVAIAADSFGHSQSTAAILAHIGIEGFFVERSDEHILLKSKTQFIWKAVSSNNISYGTVATHIRWAIHGYEDQFTNMNDQQSMCQQKQYYIENLRKQNKFLKQIIKSNHVMRYFGHDFQQFQQYQYEVMQTIMEQFSREKCGSVFAKYTNPTQYFQIYIGQVIGKQKSIEFRQQDIFPIWDYDSGLYWTGYFTTDPYHKKSYRDFSRFLHAVRKAFLFNYIQDPTSSENKRSYDLLQRFAETVAYLQHHDGISGTSKYTVMDQYEIKGQKLYKQIRSTVLNTIFQNQYPLYTNNPIMICGISQECVVPASTTGNIFVKIFNTGVRLQTEPVIVHLPINKYYRANCKYEILCMCLSEPCQCQLYLYPDVFTFTQVLLTRVQKPENIYYMKPISGNNSVFSFNATNIRLRNSNGPIEIGYKKIDAKETLRQYEHLNRYGEKARRSFTINSGKYALGNDPQSIRELSSIRKIFMIETTKVKKILVIWKREHMKTIIETSYAAKGSWKVTTLSAAEAGALQDLYIEFSSNVKNEDKFYTDSNGWLVMSRKLNTREDFNAFFSQDGKDTINGNTYPMTAFSYIEDSLLRLSVNTDRPQGVISLKEGKIWVNFDRLTSDDGKWVYETTHRNEYQKFTHYVTLQNTGVANKNQAVRKIQQLYDQPLLIQLNEIEANLRYEQPVKNPSERNKWAKLSGIQDTKFWVRVWNDTTITLRIQNIYDDIPIKVGLFEDTLSPYLSTYFGNGFYFQEMEQMSLGGNRKYEQFLREKWNLNQIVDLKHQNQIFNKILMETIDLRPLQIRTFRLKALNLKICPEIEMLGKKHTIKEYRLETSKQFPLRSQESRNIQKQIKQYLVAGDHCQGESPVLFKKTYAGRQVNYKDIEQNLQNADSPIVQPTDKYVEQVPSMDPHLNKIGLYQRLDQIKKLPKTKIAGDQEQTIQTVISPKPPGQKAQESPAETGTFNKKRVEQPQGQIKADSGYSQYEGTKNLGTQYEGIMQKINGYQVLSKDEKEAYFNVKKQRIKQFTNQK